MRYLIVVIIVLYIRYISDLHLCSLIITKINYDCCIRLQLHLLRRKDEQYLESFYFHVQFTIINQVLVCYKTYSLRLKIQFPLLFWESKFKIFDEIDSLMDTRKHIHVGSCWICLNVYIHNINFFIFFTNTKQKI